MWQKCPVCDGLGTVPDNFYVNKFNTCSVCKGTKIISTLFGTPPNIFQEVVKEEDFEQKLKDIQNGNK